jgi:GT2 family glycosyltransferase
MILHILKLYPEIGLCAILIIALLLYIILRYPIYILSRHALNDDMKPQEGNSEDDIPVSVVVIAHNQGSLLEKNLEAIASQNYKSFEIVVVNDDSDDDTAYVITRIERRFPNVRHTFTPHSARYVSHSKLSITLGVRAARNEYIVLTEGDCCPQTSYWLSAMASHFNEDTDFVIGYANYPNESSLLTSRHRLDRLVHALRYIHAAAPATSGGKAIGADNANIAFRKSVFMENKGFSSQLNLLSGENLLFVDRVARKGRTAVCASARAKIVQSAPVADETWKTAKMTQAAAAHELSRAGKLERCRWSAGSLCLCLAGLAALALILFLCMKTKYLFAAASALFFILLTALGNFLFNRSARAMGEGSFYFLFPMYELTQPLFNFGYKISEMRHRRDLMRGL